MAMAFHIWAQSRGFVYQQILFEEHVSYGIRPIDLMRGIFRQDTPRPIHQCAI